MELINTTSMVADYNLGLDPDGREYLVAIIKGTFSFPDSIYQDAVLTEQQEPLWAADIFWGEPGISAVQYESDYAPYKPRCDVLFNGSAYSPKDKPVKKVEVSLAVSSIEKSFNVVGNRYFESPVLGSNPSPPEPFQQLEFSYANAWGGTQADPDNPSNGKVAWQNPVGVGYYPLSSAGELQGKPLPNTYEPGKLPVNRKKRYRPMALGHLGRNFESRRKLAGTYDDNWRENVFPFLPADFNSLYYQATPSDQQIPYPKGGEIVTLKNLCRWSSNYSFRLPEINIPVEFTYRRGGSVTHQAVIDTVLMEPDLKRFLLTWRTSLALKRDIFEIVQVVAGKPSLGFLRARASGKRYYPSLELLIRDKIKNWPDEDAGGEEQEEKIEEEIKELSPVQMQVLDEDDKDESLDILSSDDAADKTLGEE